MEVLVCLAENAGEVVPRRRLEEAVWGDAIVSDQVLTNCISELRRHLGDDRAGPRFIETVPKRGYRLITRVTRATREPDPEGLAPSGGQRETGMPHSGREKAGSLPAERPGRVAFAAAFTAAGLLVIAVVATAYLWSARERLEPLPVSPLTSIVGTEWTGSWSPDGSQIAFMHTDNGSADISVQSLGGGRRRLVAGGPHDELTPRWSPDGSKIAFLSDRGDGLEVFWTPPTGGPERRIASTGIPFIEQWLGIYALGAMPWSPDGDSLVYSRRDAAGAVALWRIDLESGDPRRLTDPPADHGDREAAWSPDGRWIVFSRFGPDGVGLWRIPATGGESEAVLVDRHANRGASWSPDGRRLAFFSDRAGSYDLWEVPLEGGRPRQLTAGPGRDYLPVVSGTGTVLFTRWGHQTDLYWFDPTQPDVEHERLTFNTKENYAPRVAPDGRRIAYHSDRSGNYEIWLLDRGDGQDRALTDDPAEDIMPDWSPRGDEVVFLSNRDGTFRLYTVDVDGSSPRKLSEHPVPQSGAYAEVVMAGGPRWSPEGSTIGFVAPGTRGSTLWLLDPDTGKAQPSGLDHVLRFDWYLDASRVVYLKSLAERGRMGLFAADLETGREVQLLDVACTEIDVRPDGKAVAYVKSASHFGMNLYSLPLEAGPGSRLPRAAGEPEALTQGQGVWHVHGGAFAPDGAGLVYTRDLDHGDLFTIEPGEL